MAECSWPLMQLKWPRFNFHFASCVTLALMTRMEESDNYKLSGTSKDTMVDTFEEILVCTIPKMLILKKHAYGQEEIL